MEVNGGRDSLRECARGKFEYTETRKDPLCPSERIIFPSRINVNPLSINCSREAEKVAAAPSFLPRCEIGTPSKPSPIGFFDRRDNFEPFRSPESNDTNDPRLDR